MEMLRVFFLMPDELFMRRGNLIVEDLSFRRQFVARAHGVKRAGRRDRDTDADGITGEYA